MREVIQRVSRASVRVEAENYESGIGKGLLLLVGFEDGDDIGDIDWIVRKTVAMRIFDDEAGVMNRSVLDVGGEILVISQFTLFAATARGNRPSYCRASKQPVAEPLYELFCSRMEEALGKPVGRGIFGADMKVSLTNDGPVTILMDSKPRE